MYGTSPKRSFAARTSVRSTREPTVDGLGVEWSCKCGENDRALAFGFASLDLAGYAPFVQRCERTTSTVSWRRSRCPVRNEVVRVEAVLTTLTGRVAASQRGKPRRDSSGRACSALRRIPGQHTSLSQSRSFGSCFERNASNGRSEHETSRLVLRSHSEVGPNDAEGGRSSIRRLPDLTDDEKPRS